MTQHTQLIVVAVMAAVLFGFNIGMYACHRINHRGH